MALAFEKGAHAIDVQPVESSCTLVWTELTVVSTLGRLAERAALCAR